MVSELWKACSEGDLENANLLLKEASQADLEVKDQDGVTPLIIAVKNGYVDIVKVLLDRGADPNNASSEGLPEQHTADTVILGLLSAAKSKVSMAQVNTTQELNYSHEFDADPSKAYYVPPTGAYYYPGMPIPPMMSEGAVAYYAPPPMGAEHAHGALQNLPPPDVARMIPCRYYPACRYGASCMFAHPQTYVQGPPHAQYPTPYDPMMNSAYPPPFYPMPPPFQAPNGVPMGAMSPPASSHPHPPMMHARSGSEIVSPVQVPFSPSAPPPAVPYGVVSPVSPTFGHGPGPVSVPQLPPLHGGPQSPHQAPYPSVPPYGVPMDPNGQYMPQGGHSNGIMESIDPSQVPLHPQADGYGPAPAGRDGMTHHRRGSARRPSFGMLGRKPPCFFYPSGRCRNGDDCRFPHVLPDGPVPHIGPQYSTRGGSRPRASTHGGVGALEEKFSAMSVQEERHSSRGRAAPNGINTEHSSRSQSSETGGKGRPHGGFRSHHGANGNRPEKRHPPHKPQRVPNADEFPVLVSTTPPLRSPGQNSPALAVYNGPTAAQVLQAPPPPRKEPQTRGGTPEEKAPTPIPPKQF
ncbi:hypothetical protein OBBRIDRAFT_77332 [Obba rivulosa]|uniref:C3H1-type domain-containing protein n=1 Tax=Obba rivulosa TaxID=1052685 RepID=A0A8E2J4T0_9APHY|nr:hypothetical protein OBBRIDRAFT_77332 [Obba rivulosa]